MQQLIFFRLSTKPPRTAVPGRTQLTSLTHLTPRPKSNEVSAPGAWTYYPLMMILTSVAERRLMRVRMKAAVATQSLSTPVMTSSATQMHFRYV